MLKLAPGFVRDIFDKRSVIYELAKRDCQRRYFGSYLGFAWTFIQPLLFISIIYVVFAIGIRGGISDTDIPFGLYLVCGMVCWLFFAQAFSATTNVIKEHSFLVKRVDFRLSVLPIVKILSASFPHIVLVLAAVLLAWFNGYVPSAYTIQVVYYVAATSVFLLGLGWLTSSTSIFIRDVPNIVSILVQFGFWLTPIFWSIEFVPEAYRWIFKLNPVFYLVNGYRDSIVAGVPFWEHPVETVYFWSITVFLLAMGATVFRRLRPRIAEVI